MRLGSFLLPATLATGLVLLASPNLLAAQQSGAAVAAELPDAPRPQFELASVEPLAQPALGGQSQTAPAAAPAEGSSSSQAAAPQAPAKSQHDLAAEQLKEQESQRVMGVMATFNTTRNMNAAPLSSGQKFQLFIKSATDPWAYSLAAVVSGIGQAKDSEPEWGQGVKGYAHRFGANYGDYFIGNFFGNAVLPSLLHEDPRYFQKGTGSHASRFLWAAASTVWCKRDRGGWGPNYSNVMGNLIGTAIGRAYYPDEDRTVSGTITDGLTVTAEGILGSEVIEFWPDMVRRQRRLHAAKLARIEAANDARGLVPAAPAAQPQTPQK